MQCKLSQGYSYNSVLKKNKKRWGEGRIRSQEQSKQGTELSRQLGCSVERPEAAEQSLVHPFAGFPSRLVLSSQIPHLALQH